MARVAATVLLGSMDSSLAFDGGEGYPVIDGAGVHAKAIRTQAVMEQ